MVSFNIIRAGIFLVAGLIVIIFHKQLMKFQVYLIKKLNIKIKPNSKKALIILAIVFFIIAAILFWFGING